MQKAVAANKDNALPLLLLLLLLHGQEEPERSVVSQTRLMGYVGVCCAAAAAVHAMQHSAPAQSR